jgi:energy-coupling factor transporter ATP-binding protein EcfA2
MRGWARRGAGGDPPFHGRYVHVLGDELGRMSRPDGRGRSAAGGRTGGILTGLIGVLFLARDGDGASGSTRRCWPAAGTARSAPWTRGPTPDDRERPPRPAPGRPRPRPGISLPRRPRRPAGGGPGGRRRRERGAGRPQRGGQEHPALAPERPAAGQGAIGPAYPRRRPSPSPLRRRPLRLGGRPGGHGRNGPEVRRRVGLLFQDPDDQLFSTTVLDDVAFGP